MQRSASNALPVEVHELELVRDGRAYIGTLTGRLVADDGNDTISVYATNDGRVIVYDAQRFECAGRSRIRRRIFATFRSRSTSRRWTASA